MKNLTKLSPSSLGLFSECPRCFWLYKKRNIKRPEGPFPSLPGGMDNLIKAYFDRYRKKGKLPPELKGHFSGRLMPDQAILDKWRNWRQGLTFIDDTDRDFALIGAFDECFVDGDIHMPADYKTRGYELKEDTSDYYIDQLSFYALLLKKNGFKINKTGYLIYYIPENVSEMGSTKFSVEIVRLTTDIDRAYKLFKNAIEVLKGPIPRASKACQFCAWAELAGK